MEKSLTLRYNIGTLALLGLGVAVPLLPLSDSQWIPAALMFVAGSLLGAKWSEDVLEVLHVSWHSWRHIGLLFVGLLGASSIAVLYDEGALKIGVASICALVAGREAGRLPSLVGLRQYARDPGMRSRPPNHSFERTRAE